MADLITTSTEADSAGNLSPSDILVNRASLDALTYRNSNDRDAASQPPYVVGSFSPKNVSHNLAEEAHHDPHHRRYCRVQELTLNRRILGTIEPIEEYVSPSLTLTIASNDDDTQDPTLIGGQIGESNELPNSPYLLANTYQYWHDASPPSPALNTAILCANDSGSRDNLRMMLAGTQPARESQGHVGYLMNVLQEHTEDDPWSVPGFTWILPTDVGAWTHHQLPEYSREKSALWTSYPELAERLEHLCDLKPNWNGYESLAITVAAARKCARLIVAIDRHIYSQAGDPFLAPMADGGLELEWEGVCSRDLMVVIPPEGAPVRYLLTSYNEGDGLDELSGDFARDSAVNTLLESILP